MSEGKLRTASYMEDARGACIGDFFLWKKFLIEKNKPIWVPLQLLDALLRGYGQVAFANNPLSGLLIVIALGATAPKILAFSAATGFLGLLLSVLMKDSQHIIENGLTVLNPLLIGTLSCNLVPKFYGEFDAFSYLLILIGTIISVYLARSLETVKFPCTVWAFNLVELVLLFVFTTQNGFTESFKIKGTDNATSDARTNDASFIAENVTDVNVDWGMVFRGMVVSSSQLFSVDNVVTGAVIYLAVLIYSPATAGFSFAGVFVGTLAGLELGAPHNEVFTGLWGFNCFLTGAALGGNLFVINVQTAAATLVAIVYTVVLQYVLRIIFGKVSRYYSTIECAIMLITIRFQIGLPFLTLPFVISSSLFLQLRSASLSAVFPKPLQSSYPEKQRHDYLTNRKKIMQENVDDSEMDPALP
ncbi:urea transporter 2-like isoform X2 [Vespa crabro]|uniref:urea transporter 2-like isoform X2 n=1 Tax=Vespa crabro TaxID=7445 RepID=UPI001F008087|nr:urea transporter 2-like isoform X2 [Vespa crabro]